MKKIIKILSNCDLYGLTFKTDTLSEESNAGKVNVLDKEESVIASFTEIPGDSTIVNFSFFDENDLTYPLPYNESVIQNFLELYMSNKAQPEKLAYGPELLATVNYLRDSDNGPVSLEGGKSVRFFIGEGDWDDLMDTIEVSGSLNDFLHTSPICLASPLNTEVTQWKTSFSESLFSVFRLNFANMNVFYISLNYIPRPEFGEITSLLLKNNFANTPLKILPNDMPVDLIYALSYFKFTILWDKEALSQLIWNDLKNAYYYIIFLSAITPNADFEKTFAPFLKHPDVSIRSLLACDALLMRKKTGFYQEVKKTGITEQMYNWLKEQGLSA
jgi:hypothetical protein